jgi:prevent-host-death family protein
MRWQVQDAKQRFSELLRTAHAEGPQVVTRHGVEIAVVIDIVWTPIRPRNGGASTCPSRFR